MHTLKLLLVEDDPQLGEALLEALRSKGFDVRLARSGAEALASASDESFDLVLQDVRLPDADGLELLQDILALQPHCHALVMTGQATVEMAVKAMKLGAFDFITKPFSVDVLMLKLERVLEYRGLEKQLEALSDGSPTVPSIITRSPAMRMLLDTVAIVAASEVSLLLQGESGTGKKLLAELIHSMSARKDKPLIRVNCAAIPVQLIEAELFGVEKGANTGADRAKPGLLEAAAGGTLFLEELAELPLNVQAGLARALEEQAVIRIGGTALRPLDFRLICATRYDLKGLAHEGRFRKDLLYRINVVTIPIPPLRERHEDIPLLTAHFIERFAPDKQRRIRLSPDLLDMLLLRPWQGNIRELANLIEQLTLLYPGQRIREHQLPALVGLPLHLGTQFETIHVGLPLREAVATFEKRYILRVLQSLGGQKMRAAEVLGISRKVLWEKLKRADPGSLQEPAADHVPTS
ncbi:MAG: sigma-54-dependent transcriptional regulator [Desulfuromonadaceae bacterium]